MDLVKATAAVQDLLVALEVDEGDHTADTPDRVARAWATALAGYQADPARHLDRTFSAPHVPGLVVQCGIRVVSTCAHHLLPITGVATIAYLPHPGDPVVGLSKLARVLHDYAARLQIQEHLGSEVAHCIQDVLEPVGAACVITAEHGCMSLRGVEEPEAATTTVALTGAWTYDTAEVAELLAQHRAKVDR